MIQISNSSTVTSDILLYFLFSDRSLTAFKKNKSVVDGARTNRKCKLEDLCNLVRQLPSQFTAKLNPFTSKFKKYILHKVVVRIGGIMIFRLSKSDEEPSSSYCVV